MRLYDNLRDIILEASKKKVLMDKVGLSEYNADYMEGIAGPFSVIMVNKIIDHRMSRTDMTKNEVVDNLNAVTNGVSNLERSRSTLTSIIDWLKVGLDGNIKPYKNNTYTELYKESREWHNSLQSGEGDFNYIETNPVILDMRDEDGHGFYWVNLQTGDSNEECERMGHCARTSRGILYSLRENRKINDKFSLNKSHLTASIGTDGLIYQLKGAKNSKPDEKYHKYIVPLFDVKDEDGEYFIKGFGSEYESSLDFKIYDLPKEDILNLYEKRPDLFESPSLKYKLVDMDILDESVLPDLKGVLDIKLEYVSDLFRNMPSDTVYRGKNRVRISHLEKMFQEGSYDYDYVDIDYFLKNTINDENEKKIKDILRGFAKEMGEEFYEDEPVNELIERFDDNNEVRNAIRYGITDAYNNDYESKYYDEVKGLLDDYGQVISLDGEGLKMKVDMNYFLSRMDDEYRDELLDNFDIDDLESLFFEYVENYMDEYKPDYVDALRINPYPSNSAENEAVSYLLYDV